MKELDFKLSKKDLKELFNILITREGGRADVGNPFRYKNGSIECYVFIKNISPAYYQNYPDNSRVQLPSSDRFVKVLNDNLDFLILGYDGRTEVWAAWNPHIIKKRLNEKQNVSVYSRFSWQKNIPPNSFITKYLANDEKVILFNKPSLPTFFEKYRELFDLQESVLDENVHPGLDIELIRTIIDPFLQEHKVLLAVTELQSYLKNDPEYNNLSFKELFEIVNNLYQDQHK